MLQHKHKCYERDSYPQTSTGIQRHRLRALFERADKGNTPEQTGRTGSHHRYRPAVAFTRRFKSRPIRECALCMKSGKMFRYSTFSNAGGTAGLKSKHPALKERKVLSGRFLYPKSEPFSSSHSSQISPKVVRLPKEPQVLSKIVSHCSKKQPSPSKEKERTAYEISHKSHSQTIP